MLSQKACDRLRPPSPLRLVLLLLSSLPLAIGCADGPERKVLVVVNGASPVSVAIGEYYRERRHIPRKNLIALDVPLSDPMLADATAESIARADYEALVRDPIAAFLEENERLACGICF